MSLEPDAKIEETCPLDSEPTSESDQMAHPPYVSDPIKQNAKLELDPQHVSGPDQLNVALEGGIFPVFNKMELIRSMVSRIAADPVRFWPK